MHDPRGVRELIHICELAGLFMDPDPNDPKNVKVTVAWGGRVDPSLEREIRQREPEILQYFKDLQEEADSALGIEPTEADHKIQRYLR